MQVRGVFFKEEREGYVKGREVEWKERKEENRTAFTTLYRSRKGPSMSVAYVQGLLTLLLYDGSIATIQNGKRTRGA